MSMTVRRADRKCFPGGQDCGFQVHPAMLEAVLQTSALLGYAEGHNQPAGPLAHLAAYQGPPSVFPDWALAAPSGAAAQLQHADSAAARLCGMRFAQHVSQDNSLSPVLAREGAAASRALYEIERQVVKPLPASGSSHGTGWVVQHKPGTACWRAHICIRQPVRATMQALAVLQSAAADPTTLQASDPLLRSNDPCHRSAPHQPLRLPNTVAVTCRSRFIHQAH